VSPRPATRAQIGLIHSLYRSLGQDPPTVSTRAGAYQAIEHAKRRLAASPPRPAAEPPPSAAQMHDVRVYARRAGVDVPQPATAGECARLLVRMKAGEWP
jgi:hypothetical protein